MSLDSSLKGKSSLERHRNVLRRGERIAFLEDAEKWAEEKSSVFGLVKVAHRKVTASKKAKTEEAAATTEGAAPGAAPAAAAAAPAAGAKAAAAPAAKAKK